MLVQSNWSWLPTILLLGFYADVSERTIISAGTLRLRLSGLKSRAHLIRKYSFPSCQAQSSLHALSRLYVQKGFCSQDMWTTDSFVWPPFSLRTAHASAFRLFLLSSAGGVGNRPRWYTPWVHHWRSATNRKVPSTSTMGNSSSPFCWQHASPLVRTNSQIHVSQRICPWWSQPTHSAVCTERVLQNRLPTRPVQKAVQAYLTFWLWQKYLLTRWWGCKCSSAGFITNLLMMSSILAFKGIQARLRAFLCVSSSVPKSSSLFAADFNQLVF